MFIFEQTTTQNIINMEVIYFLFLVSLVYMLKQSELQGLVETALHTRRVKNNGRWNR